MSDLISRQAAIDTLNVGTEFLRRVLDETDIVGAERAKYEWGLGLIESYISDMKELPSADVIEVVRCKDCKLRKKNTFCLHNMRYEDDNGFCSYGERKDEGL